MVPNELELINTARTLNYPTPFFYTSKEVLKHNYSAFTGLFDNCEIYYALKANSEPEVLSFLNDLGCGFEAASFYEIDMLLQVGVHPNKIIYGTSIKPATHIADAFKYRIDRFAADSREELEKIAQYAPGARVFIRAIVDDSGSVFQMSERFGSPLDQVKDLVHYARHLELRPYGISFYVGSQATVVERWYNGIFSIRPIVWELFNEGITLDMINIGGGFPVIYSNHKEAPHLRHIVEKVHDALHVLPYIPKVFMEPGRAIVATSTVLVASVIARSVKNGKVWLCLDAGIYNALYEAMIHQGSTKYDVHPFVQPDLDVEMMECVLTGPTGDSLDVITRDAVLPAYTSVGDRLIFENAGAYTTSMTTPFNGFPKPKTYIG